MSDTVSRLLAALEALERTTPHAPDCASTWLRCTGCHATWPPSAQHTYHGAKFAAANFTCDCDYDVRRRLAIAQRTEAAVRAAVAVYKGAESSVNVGVAVFASPGRDT